MTLLVLCVLAAAPVEAQPLTLERAIELALGKSGDLEAALIALESAALSPRRLDVAFAWTAWAEAGLNRDAAPRTTEFQPQTMTTAPASIGMRRLFPFGTAVEAQLAGTYFDAPFPELGIPIPVIERGFTQSFTLTATHPLYGSAPQELVALQQQELSHEVQATAARTADSLEQVLGEVHRRFWAWALAKQSLHTANAAVAAAQALRDQTERKSRRGLAEARDRLRAQAALEVALDQKLAVERTLDAARRALLDRIGAPDSFTDASFALDAAVPPLAFRDVVAKAEASSLALRALARQEQARESGRLLAHAQQRARLLAVGKVGEQALFPEGDTFADEVGPVGYLGLRYEVTFGNSDALVRAEQANLDLKRLVAEQARMRERVHTAASEIDAAITSATARAQAARQLLRTQGARYAEEQRNYSIGRTVLRDLIEVQQDVTRAQFLLDAALVSLQMAASERDLLTGEATVRWRQSLGERSPAYRRAVAETPATGPAGSTP